MKYIAVAFTVCALTVLTSCRPSAEKLLATADKYHANKKYKEAEILYQKVLTKDKKNAEAYYKGGLNLLDEGKPREATQYLRRAVDLQPANTQAEAKLAEIYLAAYLSAPDRLKQLRPEIDDLEKKIVQHDPNSFDALRIEAVLDLADHKTEQALQVFAKANAAHPHSRQLVGWYAQSLVAAGHPDQAEALMQDMIAHDKTWQPAYDFLFLLYRQQQNAAKAEQILREHLANDPTSASAITNLANFLALTNRQDEAENVMKRVLSDPKNFPLGHSMMGDFYAREKKFDQAIDQYQQAANADPAHAASAQERIVVVDTMRGKPDEALALAKSIADKNPKDVTAAEMYASLLLQVGMRKDAKNAVSEIAKLSKNNSSNPILHLDLSKAYVATNENDQALNEVTEALQEEAKSPNPRPAVLLPGRLIAGRLYGSKGQPAQTLDQVNQVLAAQPDNPEARLLKDQALVALNQGGQALDDLQSLVKQYPQSADARLALGQIYMMQQQYGKAQEQYEAVWNGAHDVRGYLGLQSVKFASGKIDEALKGIADLVAKYPDNPQYRFQLAEIQTTAAQRIARTNQAQAKAYLTQAIDNYKAVLKTAPKAAEVWISLGSLQQVMGQQDAALASYEQASASDPKNVKALVVRGALLEAMNRRKEAADLYNQALGVDPNNPLALNNLAFLDAEQGNNLEQAMDYAQRAKKQAPKSPDVSDTLGFVYLQKNLNSQALEIFRQNVLDQPQNPTFHLHLAMALLKKGDKQGAKEEADKALKMAPPQQQDVIRKFESQIG